MPVAAVLVEDDERSGRVLARLLEEQGIEALHVPDVRGALALLAEAALPVALLIVGLHDEGGVASVQQLRAAAPASTRLLVTTAQPTARMVGELAAVGVTDVLLKPLRADAVRPRLRDALHRVTLGDVGARPLLAHGATVLIIDGSSAYRRLLGSQAGTWWEVTTAATGVEGLALARATPPQAVFLGARIGLLGPLRFAQRLREDEAGRQAHLFLLASAGELPAEALVASVEAVLPRTWAPDLVRQSLGRFVQP